MEQISKWRKNRNQISEHKIEIGTLKEKILSCENDNRETHIIG